MIIRKYYRLGDNVVFTHDEYPKGANKEDVLAGKLKPRLAFKSFTQDAKDLEEITEDQYRDTLVDLNKKSMEDKIAGFKGYSKALDSAKVKLLALGLTEDEFRALVRL